MKHLLSICVLFCITSFASAQSITILDPNGGEVIAGCSTYTIRWNDSGVSDYFSIDYSTDGGSNWVSVTSFYLTTAGSFSWSVPKIFSTQCKIRIIDSNNSSTKDESDSLFTITDPLKLKSPKGGEVYAGLTQETVSFSPFSTSNRYNFYYSTDNGTNWKTITTSYYTTDSVYTWNVPNDSCTQCLFKITDYYNSCITAYSDSNFTITKAPVKLTTPNGGEQWWGGAGYYIYWNQLSITTTTAVLDYSLDSGSTWISIVTSTSNDGSHYWTPPAIASTQALVRVSEYNNPTEFDISDTTFTILYPLTIANPNGGESIDGCSYYNITWNSSPSIYRFNLYYSIDSGSNWTTMYYNYYQNSTSNYYNWYVPNTIDTNRVLFKVVNYYATTVDDVSDSFFTITPTHLIDVTSPNGGESIQGLDTFKITWDTLPGTSGRYVVQYSPNGSSWYTISSSVYDTMYNWVVPNSPGTNYTVRVYDYSASCRIDESDSNFSITPAQPILTTPNGGEQWWGGAGYYIYWNAATFFTSVKLDYSLDSGTTWIPIISATSNDGSHYWSPPAVSTTQALIRAANYSDTSWKDLSDSTFTILYPINLTKPNGGDTILGCGYYNIEWTSSPSIYRFNIYYSIDSGTNWYTIYYNYYQNSTSNSYNWYVPNTLDTNTVLIKVVDYYNQLVGDVSDTFFTVKPTDLLSLTSPNGGESIQGLDTFKITWDTLPGTSGRYVVQYTPNGSSWYTISSSVYDTMYNWVAPNVPGSNYKIRVYDYGASCRIDESDSNFTITPAQPILTTPNGGEQWWGGAGYYIYWNSATFYQSVKLEYSIDSGSTWLSIISATSNDGSHYWSPPAVSTTQALIRAANYSDTAWKDLSDSTFTILYPLTLTDPLGGDTILGCGYYNIKWNSSPSIYRFNLYYSIDSGNYWYTIYYNYYQNSTSNSYNWYVPNTIDTNTVLLKVVDYYNTSVSSQSDTFFTIDPTELITVTSPNGGESIQGLDTFKITWDTLPGTSGRYVVQYSPNGSSWYTISSSVYDTMYNWVAPNVPGSNYKIRVYDYGASCRIDESDSNFTITPAQPILTSPNGGEQWWGGTGYYIYWDAATFFTSVKLDYSLDSGTTWIPIISATSNDGSHYWSPPAVATTQALIRAANYSDTSWKDLSDSTFTILYPITLSNPNGGDTILGCNYYNIQWASSPSIYRFNLYYSIDSGNYWYTIYYNYYQNSSSNFYNWYVPNTIDTNRVLFKVVNYYSTTVGDVSDSFFTITPTNLINITSPNGGESIQGLDTVKITWDTLPGTSGRYVVQYTPNGSSWYTISSSVYDTMYNWVTPNVPNWNYKIRVYDYSASCRIDESDSTFEITPAQPILTSPNGGEQWWGGAGYYIYWNAASFFSSVKLDYSLDSGTTWIPIISATSNDGSHYWSPPAVATTQALIRAANYSDTSWKDLSDSTFTILYPITVSNPNGGDSLLGCDYYNIQWTSSPSIYRFNLYYSIDSGTNWYTIYYNYYQNSTSNSYNWYVPNTIDTNRVLFKVVNYYSTTVGDVSDSFFTVTPTQLIEVTSPNGGESIQGLDTFKITWDTLPGTSGRYVVQYTPNGSSWYTLSSSVYDTMYNWVVPNVPSTYYKVRVYDYSASCRIDESDSFFTVTPAQPILTTPNGGEQWWGGSGYYIYWNASTFFTSVRLEYSIDSGATYNTIITATSNDGSHYWIPPNTPSDKCIIRASNYNDNNWYDISDSVFSILPAISITTPNGDNGNENWRGCTVTSLTWTSAPNITRFNLYYSLDSGFTWTQIAYNYYNTSTTISYNWNIPNVSSTKALVKVTNYYNGATLDESDKTFTIKPPVTVTQPAHGGVLTAGNVHQIKWIADGISTYYNIELSTNNGSSWSTIANNYNTSNYVYNWLVPNTPSTTCLIRVTDAINSCKWDISDAPFTIDTMPAAITIVQANGGDSLPGCESYNITWSINGASNFFDLYFSIDGGNNWTVIDTNYNTTTYIYAWDVPNMNENLCLFKVVDHNNSGNWDQSDAAFTIYESYQASIAASGVLAFCEGDSVILTSSQNYGNLWSTGDSTESITVRLSGNYKVTTTDSSGCTATSLPTTVTVHNLPALPTLSMVGDTVFCQGDSTQLTSSSTSGNNWSPGGNITQSIWVKSTGNYSVTVRNNNNCEIQSDSIAITVNANPSTPTISASGATTFCLGDTLTLTSSSSINNVWNTNDSTTAILVDSSGSYSVSVIDSNQCSATSTPVAVTVHNNPAIPVITSSDTTSICSGDSVTLFSSSAVGNLWSPGGDTTQSLLVFNAGNFKVTVTDGNNCSSTSAITSVTITPKATAPTISAGSALEFCDGDSVTLTSSFNSANHWSNGDTNKSITVHTSGIYTVSDQLGCADTSDTTIVVVNTNPNAPTITTSDTTSFCAGNTVTLYSSYSTGNQWNPGNSAADSVIIDTSGHFTVTYTDSNSCSATSDSIEVAVESFPATPVVTASDSVEFCFGDSITLTSNTASGNQWSTGDTTQAITVSSSGNYHVYLGSACPSYSDTFNVVVNTLPTNPSITTSDTTSFCQGGQVVLHSSYSAKNLWSPGSQNTDSIVVTSSGSFSVAYTDSNGCSSNSDTVTVNVSSYPSVPTITLSGSNEMCQGDTLTLTSSANSGNLWSTGDSNRIINTDSSGSYFVKVGDACPSYSDTIIVTVAPLPSKPIITAGGATSFCDGNTVTLSSNYSTGNTWSPGNQTSNSLIASTSGSYSVTVADSNGCKSTSDTTDVIVFALPSDPSITVIGDTVFCDGDTVLLVSSFLTGNSWNTGTDSTQILSVLSTGQYNVEYTDSNGCSSTSRSVDVQVHSLPSKPTISASGPLRFCTGDTVTLTSSTASTYLWQPGSFTTPSIIVTTAGSYNVAITDSNGCSNTSAYSNVIVDVLPTATVTADTTVCPDASFSLSAGGGQTYSWSPGTELSCTSCQYPTVTPTSSRKYTVEVTDFRGCKDEAEVIIGVRNRPTANAGLDTSFCDGSSVTLNATGGVSYVWAPATGLSCTSCQAPSASPSIDRTYEVTAMDFWGCTDVDSVEVKVNPLPTVNAGADDQICNGDTVNLSGSASGGSGNYNHLWSPAAKLLCSTCPGTAAWPSTTTTYTLDVTDSKGCTGSDDVIITVNQVPSASAGQDEDICQGDTVQLLATGGISYLWTPSLGLNDSTIEDPMAYPDTTTIYAVHIEGANGCSMSDSLTVNVHALPPVPPITQTGNTLSTTSGYATYTWYFNGTYIAFSNSETHTPAKEGTYTVKVENEFGCENTSDEHVFKFTAINEFSALNSIGVHPNPSAGEYKLTISLKNVADVEVKVMSLLGETLSLQLLTGHKEYSLKQDMSDLSSGVYLMKVSVAGESWTRKLILEK